MCQVSQQPHYFMQNLTVEYITKAQEAVQFRSAGGWLLLQTHLSACELLKQPKLNSVCRDLVLEVGFPHNPVLHELNATELSSSPHPTSENRSSPWFWCHLKHRRIEQHGGNSSPSWIFQHKVHFMLSVALETRLPLKKDQYAFIIYVYTYVFSGVCFKLKTLPTHHVVPWKCSSSFRLAFLSDVCACTVNLTCQCAPSFRARVNTNQSWGYQQSSTLMHVYEFRIGISY